MYVFGSRGDQKSLVQLMQANEQLKVHEKMEREFINVAAHELRNPVQPILGLSEILLSKIKDKNRINISENRSSKTCHQTRKISSGSGRMK